MTFEGFPVAALDFYDDLEMDNTKSFWEAHKGVYKEAVEAPMKALTGELEKEFGTAKVFRPYRDVRFARDKTPYKTSQGAYVAVAPATGWYVELSARGVRLGAGFYDATPARLAALRQAVADDRTGPGLQAEIDGLVEEGWELGGDTVKTSPRGYPADHPRIGLLRHKQLFVGRSLGFDEVIHSPALVGVVRDHWRRAGGLVTFLADHGS